MEEGRGKDYSWPYGGSALLSLTAGYNSDTYIHTITENCPLNQIEKNYDTNRKFIKVHQSMQYMVENTSSSTIHIGMGNKSSKY